MSVAVPVIDSIDGFLRRAYLKPGVSLFHWIEDIYREYIRLRRTDEALRKWAPMMRQAGNDPKGGGKYTPRFITLLEGFRVIPYDENILITVTGEAITDNPDIDPDPFDTSTRTNPLKLYITPPAAEIVKDVDALAAIARMSFGNMISVDPEHGDSIASFTGDPLLLGNMEHPAANYADAMTIATRMNLHDISIFHTSTIPIGVDVSGAKLIGQNAIRTHLTLEAGAICDDVEIIETTLTGTLDGGTLIRNSVIDGINYFNGMLYDCAFTDNEIVLGGPSVAFFMNCKGINAFLTPATINCNNDTTPLIMRNFEGSLIIKNRTVAGDASILFNGQVTIDASCTAGTFQLSGIGHVVDNSTGTCVVNSDKVVDAAEIPRDVWGFLIDNGLSAQQIMQVMVSALAGKVSGAGTGNISFRDLADMADRITSEVDDQGNRTSVSLNV